MLTTGSVRIASYYFINEITILTVLAETRCFELVSNQKQLASYAGFDIIFDDSGMKKGKSSISKKGNKFIRKALFMPALFACRGNPQLKAFYQRLLANGKNNKLAIIAVACILTDGGSAQFRWQAPKARSA